MARRTKPRSKRQRMSWREWRLEITHTPDYLGDGTDHLEVRVLAPEGAPLPITDTGYRSHFMPGDLLAELGGPKAFVAAWLESEAKSKAWARLEAKWRQLELELVMPASTDRPRRRRAARQKPEPS